MNEKMSNLKIYDKDKKVAELSPDQGGIVRLIFAKSIGDEAKRKVTEVFSGIKPKDTAHPLGEIAARYKKEGYEVLKKDKESRKNELEQKEVTPEQKREAKFIHESNLIEEVNEISYDEILNAIVNNEFGGHVSAWKFAKQLALDKTPLEGRHVCKMQQLITDEQSQFSRHNLDDKFRGKIRDVYVSIAGRLVEIPTEEKFNAFFERLNKKLETIDTSDLEAVLRFAAQNHLEYEEGMHPFADGNGRTGRLIINYILTYCGYDPLIITSADKQKYYSAFKGADIENSKDMEEYFIEQYKRFNK